MVSLWVEKSLLCMNCECMTYVEEENVISLGLWTKIRQPMYDFWPLPPTPCYWIQGIYFLIQSLQRSLFEWRTASTSVFSVSITQKLIVSLPIPLPYACMPHAWRRRYAPSIFCSIKRNDWSPSLWWGLARSYGFILNSLKGTLRK